ncbi:MULTISPECIES: DUF3043 domain-containing protein [Micromonospora]|uniref:DUF3043 domain-containing protein n=1 Tax=Micromonospora solifontis TaxID=2487138 RepID=A0ABX9WB56_9ACTN|nr:MULTISPECIES: DUF3043 domain-containing protein [Micromonospora]NES12365.1 DUF3043 domain-containing protein [Micromonospora sp. PPF5-17B]NES38734.1 DUF3043 domain-containing protein [Micromonospora solifontis]NES54152.1 DUF3043 domain-containing protein [Micromonospora sp. PPF5-6]RNL93589.1 DUF3043 domain-containing protein [Micromonospora solifontis]
MPSLFRRKPDLVEESVTTVTPDEESAAARPRGYTPSKKELGQVTPKRPGAGRRPAGAPSRPLTKEEAREQRRTARAEAAAEFRREGGPRDRGPERLLARNVVDSRRTVGTWFFGGALIVLIGSNQAMPPIVRLLSNLLWGLLALGVVVDSVLISRKIKKLVRERYPKSTEKLGSLYFYAIMRSITFRRMRAPAPRVNIGDKI